AIASTKNTADAQRHGPSAPPSASSIQRKKGVAMMRAPVMMFGAFQLLGAAEAGALPVMPAAYLSGRSGVLVRVHRHVEPICCGGHLDVGRGCLEIDLLGDLITTSVSSGVGGPERASIFDLHPRGQLITGADRRSFRHLNGYV